MVRVLLADTDLDNTKRIKNYIVNNYEEMEIVETVTDSARNLVEVLKSQPADLIIADIRFFGSTAYIILHDLRENFNEIRFILYGTYADNEYIKRGKSFGALDIMYKPIRPAEVARCLKTAADYFEKTKKYRKDVLKIENEYNEKFNLFKDIFLKDLFQGRIQNQQEILRTFEYFHMKFDKGFTVLLARVERFKEILPTITEMEKHMISYKITLLINEALKDYKVETSIIDFNLVAALLGGFEDLDNIIALCEKLKTEIFERSELKITIGLGRTYQSSSDIVISYREAESALRYRFHIGENTVIPIHYMEPTNIITYRYPFEKERRLISTAVIGEYDYCRILLVEIFDSLRACEPLPEKFLSRLVTNILIEISRYLSEQNIILHAQFAAIFSSKEALELADINDAFLYLDKALKNFCNLILNYHDKLNEDLISSAKIYCREHYHESFSLNKIASSLNTTPEYLNRLFQNRENKSVFDYAVKMRMDEAKRLMRLTDLNDESIAIKLGYEDARYYKGVFKQYEGVSTSEFRTKYFAKTH